MGLGSKESIQESSYGVIFLSFFIKELWETFISDIGTGLSVKETNVTFWNYAFSSGDNFYTSSDTIGCFIQHNVTAKRNFLSADHKGNRCGLMLCFRFPNDRREKFGELLIFTWNLRKESYPGLKLVTESFNQAYLYSIILQGAFLWSCLDMSPVSGVKRHAYDTTWYFG